MNYRKTTTYNYTHVSYALPTCYASDITHSGDDDLLDDDTYEDDLLGNAIFCHDYITKH